MSAEAMAALFPPDKYPYHWEEVPMKGKTLAFLTANCIIEAVVVLVVGLRFYSRMTTSSFGWDDWFVLLAKILCIGTLTVATCLCVLGSGYYVAEVAINLSSVYLLIFILQGLFLFANMAVKLSVCFFYLRIFVDTGMRIATFATMGLVTAWAVAHFIAAVFICDPVQGQWDLRFMPTAVCGDQMKFFQSGLSINVVLDFIVMVLPLYTIWNLNMRTSDKIGISTAFLIGIGMTIVGIIRAIYVTTTSMTGDVTATLPTNLFLTVVEQQFAIVTVSIPMLRPLWRRYRARFGGYSLEESEKATGGSAGYKAHLPNGTFGGSGGKKSNRRGGGDPMLDTQFELRTVTNKTDIKGADADANSLPSDGNGWDSAESRPGSQTHLGAKKKNKGGVITVRDEWQVSVS